VAKPLREFISMQNAD